jgi:hypothetical protein
MAIEEKDKIKDLFSSKLKDFEADIPGNIWAGIDQALSQPQVVVKPTSSRYLLLRTISVAASIVGTIVLAAAVFFLSRPDGTMQRAHGDFRTNAIERKAIINGEEETSGWDLVSIYQKEYPIVENIDEGVVSDRYMMKLEKPSTLLCDVSNENRNLTDIVKIQPKTRIEDKNRVQVQPTQRRAPIILPERKKSNGTFLSLNTNSGILSPSVKGETALTAFYSKNNTDIDESFSDKIVDLDHNQPISFGFLINKELSSKVSIETGLTYTYLSSRFKSKADNDVSGKTNFHYLGVPINVNYNLLQFGKGNLYLSVGGKIEKDIQGRLKWSVKNENTANMDQIESASTPNSTMFNNSQYSERANIHQENLQFSAQMSIGASYPIYDKLHVYGMVGGSYYFDANNEYPTVYSDKKVQLDLNLGLKWKF